MNPVNAVRFYLSKIRFNIGLGSVPTLPSGICLPPIVTRRNVRFTFTLRRCYHPPNSPFGGLPLIGWPWMHINACTGSFHSPLLTAHILQISFPNFMAKTFIRLKPKTSYLWFVLFHAVLCKSNANVNSTSCFSHATCGKSVQIKLIYTLSCLRVSVLIGPSSGKNSCTLFSNYIGQCLNVSSTIVLPFVHICRIKDKIQIELD
jgi:hypothetical protein